MPYGAIIYANDGSKYAAGTPAAYGVVEVKLMFQRRAHDFEIPLPAGFDPRSLTYGASAEALCKALQAQFGVKADGACGPATMRAGFKPDLRNVCLKVGQDYNQVCKLISLESSFNPSAFAPGPSEHDRYPNSTWDRGIAQINSVGGVSDADAFDVRKSFAYAAARLKDSIEHYDGELDVAIASYNVGATGAAYYRAGRNYVTQYTKQVC